MSGILDKYNESIRLTYNYTYRMLTHLKNIKDNYKKLKDADDITLEVYRDSIIKKYETLEDLTWKLLSKIFKADGLEINNPRGCYKQAFKEGLIQDMIIWNEILLARNSTAHIYDESDYEAIKNNILEKYIGAIENLLNKISMEKL
ncbi:nucleotidyltransferase [Clostridium novyi A str. 4552]|uniref:Nucleotidyltransferase n=1 Tax=Clostridium novyi A str. 4552 TaxID=1444289 RepID=A0A0A0I538_CLONO|nr:HI0074 family nucleotidyltransferase substrate-binding subunit [Clostridium novyi]KGM95436.1 nucleotidyltransferase [Clostridium novyi A str. 4552]